MTPTKRATLHRALSRSRPRTSAPPRLGIAGMVDAEFNVERYDCRVQQIRRKLGRFPQSRQQDGGQRIERARWRLWPRQKTARGLQVELEVLPLSCREQYALTRSPRDLPTPALADKSYGLLDQTIDPMPRETDSSCTNARRGTVNCEPLEQQRENEQPCRLTRAAPLNRGAERREEHSLRVAALLKTPARHQPRARIEISSESLGHTRWI